MKTSYDKLQSDRKKLYEQYQITVVYHDARIKELRKAISDSKRDIKKHKLLKQQAKTTYKLEVLA